MSIGEAAAASCWTRLGVLDDERQRTERQSVEREAGHGIGDELDEEVDEAS